MSTYWALAGEMAANIARSPNNTTVLLISHTRVVSKSRYIVASKLLDRSSLGSAALHKPPVSRYPGPLPVPNRALLVSHSLSVVLLLIGADTASSSLIVCA